MENAKQTIDAATMWWLREIIKKMDKGSVLDKDYDEFKNTRQHTESVADFLIRIKDSLSNDDYDKVNDFSQRLGGFLIKKRIDGYKNVSLINHNNQSVGDLQQACLGMKLSPYFLPSNVLMSIDFTINIITYIHAGERGEIIYMLAEDL